MPRLSMNELTTLRWSFEEDVFAYAEAGYQAMGVWRQKLADYGEEKGAELLADAGLAVSNLLWAGGFTGSDGRSFRESVDDALEAIDLAGQLRAGALVVYTGARNGHTRNHAFRLVRSALAKLLPRAVELGVTLALEPMHPGCGADWTFLDSLDEALQLQAHFDHPRLRLVMDTYHVGTSRSVVDAMVARVDRIAVVHLGDGRGEPCGEQDRCLLGEGQVPLEEIIDRLEAAGYDGDYDVELMGEEIEMHDYESLLAHSKQFYDASVLRLQAT